MTGPSVFLLGVLGGEKREVCAREDSKGHLIISQKLKTTVSRFQKSSESKGKELHSDHLRRGRKGFNFNLITVCKVDIILEY